MATGNEQPSGGRDTLSEDRIVAAALRVAERDGFEHLTMRNLAAELDFTQMATYYYVKSKEDLLNLVTDSIYGQIELPTVDDGPWDVQLRLLCDREFEAARRYRGLSGFLPHSKLGPAQLGVYEAHLDILKQAGFDEDDAMRAMALIRSYMVGRFVLADRLAAVSSRQRMVKFLGDRATADSGSRLIDFALDNIIAGLRERLAT